jgi:hypothetical protein
MQSGNYLFIFGNFDLSNKNSASTTRLNSLINALKFKQNIVQYSNNLYVFIKLLFVIVTQKKSINIIIYIYGDFLFLNLFLVFISKLFHFITIYDFVEFRKYRLKQVPFYLKFPLLISNYLIPRFSDKVIVLSPEILFKRNEKIIYWPLYVDLEKLPFFKKFSFGKKINIVYNGDFDSKDGLELLKNFISSLDFNIFSFSFVTKQKRENVLKFSKIFEKYSSIYFYEASEDIRSSILTKSDYAVLFRGDSIENRYSFPTRFLDFIYYGNVLITNNKTEVTAFFTEQEVFFYDSDCNNKFQDKLTSFKNYVEVFHNSIQKLKRYDTVKLLNNFSKK